MTGHNNHRPTRGSGLTDLFDQATAQAAQCQGKDGFPSRAAAHRVLDERRKRTSRRLHPHKGKRAIIAKIVAYPCEHCGLWHLGMGNRR